MEKIFETNSRFYVIQGTHYVNVNKRVTLLAILYNIDVDLSGNNDFTIVNILLYGDLSLNAITNTL